jgi:uncharacterized protein YabE (DUF348 family)
METLRRFFAGRALSVRQVALGMAVLGVGMVYAATQRSIVIRIDGSEREVRTHARTVAAALRDAGYNLQPADRVSPGGDASVSDGMQIHLARARRVLVQLVGEARQVVTPDIVPANILASAGVRVYPGDWVWADGERLVDPSLPLEAPPTRLRYQRAQPIRLVVDGVVRQLASAAPTLGQALQAAGMTLHGGDRLVPRLAARLTGPMDAVAQSGRQVTVSADGVVIHSFTTAETIAEALSELGVYPLGLDYTHPDLSDPIPADGAIRLVRVQEETIVEQVPLAFDTVYEPVADLEIDNQRLLEPGAYGVKASRVRIRYEDGVETGRTVEGSWEAVEPRSRVLGYGTQIVIRTLATDDGTLEYWRAVTMWATSYAEKFFPRDWPYLGITASGLRLTKGIVAIDRRYIPFGTRMYVPGYGHALAADTGSNIQGRWIDLGYDNDNYVPWAQYVTVYFLTPVPDNIVWVIP